MTYFIEMPEEKKEVIFPSELSRRPLPLVLTSFVSRSVQDRHMGRHGQIPDLGCYHLEDCNLGPSGILFSQDGRVFVARDLSGQYFRDSVTSVLSKKDPSDLLVRAHRRSLDITQAPKGQLYVYIGTTGFGVYGHWILDILPKVWLFLASQSTRQSNVTSIKYVLPSGTPEWAYFMLYAAFGIDKDQTISFQRDKLVRFERLIIPSMLRSEDIMSPKLELFTQHLLDKHAKGDDKYWPRKIYVSRREIKSYMKRGVQNQDDLESIAISKGFTVLDPSTLSWPEQIRLFSKAEVVAGPFGSGLHNTIFSPSTAITLVLGASRMNGFQSGISALKSQRMGYLYPTHEEKIDNDLSLTYDPVALSDCFDEIERCL